MSTSPFSWPIRVYWEDTDGEGVVYYANYFKFMERARTEWLRSLGVEQGPLKHEHGLMFVVVDAEAHYRRPARYGELLQVTCLVEEHTRTTLTIGQQVYRDTASGERAAGERAAGELLVAGRVRVACIDAQTHRPMALPEILGRPARARRRDL